MKQRVLRFFIWWTGLMLLMTVFRIIFFIVEPAFAWSDISELWNIVTHGLAMDLSMSAYIMVIPGLVLIASVWTSRYRRKIMKVYFWIVAVLLALAYSLDAVLYPYWGFRLDVTPFFYFFTSPGAALASMGWFAEVLIVMFIVGISYALYKGLRLLWYLIHVHHITEKRDKILTTIVMSLCVGVLIVPVRGGLSVATMTPGHGFYSNDMRYNQATVNPLFSLLYSLTHWDDLGGSFRFYHTDKEAQDALAEFEAGTIDTKAEIPAVSLKTTNPDVYIIILESFSAQLMPTLGGEPIAVRLDEYADKEGLLFTDFYAESFRTDRALPAILSGYPSQPTTSAMRFTSKLANLPSIAKVLRDNGWTTTYYYGGDADFTNMNAYLRATGYNRVVSDDDFDSANRGSKWGVHDGPVFERALTDLSAANGGVSPRLTVIQTSSSHEPFEVPYNSKFTDERLNAFSYTDKCLGDFLDGLKDAGVWDKALIAIVPDHWGCYPRGLTDYTARHHIPLVLTGGALQGTPAKVAVTGSQSDIAPTLMTLLQLQTDSFVFGHDLLNSAAPHYARFSESDWFGVRAGGKTTAVTCEGDRLLAGNEEDARGARAFVQLLYSDLNKR